jgi:hypothetical protein
VKLGDTGVDDLLNEAQFVLRDDGRRRALLLLRLLAALYRIVRAIIRLVLYFPWRRGALGYPELGDAPFNLTDAELEREWREP